MKRTKKELLEELKEALIKQVGEERFQELMLERPDEDDED